MNTLATNRHNNSRFIKREFCSNKMIEFAHKSGMSSSQCSNYLKDNPQYSIGNKVAAKIEEAFGLHSGDLDLDSLESKISDQIQYAENGSSFTVAETERRLATSLNQMARQIQAMRELPQLKFVEQYKIVQQFEKEILAPSRQFASECYKMIVDSLLDQISLYYLQNYQALQAQLTYDEYIDRHDNKSFKPDIIITNNNEQKKVSLNIIDIYQPHEIWQIFAPHKNDELSHYWLYVLDTPEPFACRVDADTQKLKEFIMTLRITNKHKNEKLHISENRKIITHNGSAIEVLDLVFID